MSISEADVRRLTDKRIYEEELAHWLPDEIIDCHVHLGLRSQCGHISPERLRNDWAMQLGLYQSWEELREHYGLLFPGKLVRAIVFGGVFREVDTRRNNAYIEEGIGREDVCAGALFVTRPEYPAEQIRRAFARGFIGIKPYPDLAPVGAADVRIGDFLPKHHLAELERIGGLLMLHIPGPGRLADDGNIRDILAIADDYPSIKIIVAHVGRAYCLPTARVGLPHFANRDSIYFDIAANLNHEVFREALDIVGPDRLLFGSDLPVTMVRGIREHKCDGYVNHLEQPSCEAGVESAPADGGHTYLLYEELRALIRAIQQAGYGKEAARKIAYANSAALLGLTQQNLSDTSVVGTGSSPAVGCGGSTDELGK